MPSIRFQNREDEVRVANIYCIGRNYARHIEELGNTRGDAPVVFLKPTGSLINEADTIELPSFSLSVHHETELVALIGRGGRHIPEGEALAHVAGYGLGLDLTARDTQDALKAKGLPWLLSKGFATAACVSAFVPAEALPDPGHATFTLHVNGVLRQTGDTAMMLYPLPYLISWLSGVVPLLPGDLLFTGTPEGVAPLAQGDRLELRLGGLLRADFSVA
jgi:2-keto-4-pentenoate hydratase/2-oxohepta-3-ene-1,7-dioic acid hydratase in catechol pathway